MRLHLNLLLQKIGKIGSLHTFMVVNVYNSNTGYFQSTFVFTGTTGPEIANPRRFAA